ncbi:hypothetical protein, partial [Enterobacter hormaechei]|uniref:hypothetical protein n=1 Tax=Enterobacter hormaechei TaxID=158836 RepID=UPI00203E8799
DVRSCDQLAKFIRTLKYFFQRVNLHQGAALGNQAHAIEIGRGPRVKKNLEHVAESNVPCKFL